MEGNYPIINVWGVYAYYLNYQEPSFDYLKAWWNVVNRSNKRFEQQPKAIF